jgi:hypothetical protein
MRESSVDLFVAEANARWWWTRRVLSGVVGLLSLVVLPHVVWADDDVEPPEAAIPLVDRDKVKAWKNQLVNQESGGKIRADGLVRDVHVIQSPDDLVRDEYWTLSEGAVGRVTRVDCVEDRPELTVYHVRFEGSPDGSPGWTKHRLPYRDRRETVANVRTRSEYSEGSGLTTTTDVQAESKRREGFELLSGSVGNIVEVNADHMIVRYTTDRVLARKRPRIGDLVVRGPDWCSGYADGGEQAWGQHQESLEGKLPIYTGRVVSEGLSGNELRVKWDVTGRVAAHRFNVDRFYDVEVVPEQNPRFAGERDE